MRLWIPTANIWVIRVTNDQGEGARDSRGRRHDGERSGTVAADPEVDALQALPGGPDPGHQDRAALAI